MSGNTPVETNDAIRHALGYMAAMRSAIRCGESWSDEEFGSVQKVMDRLEAAQSERDQLRAELAAAKNEVDQVAALYDECHENFVLAESEIVRLNGEVQCFDRECIALAADNARLRDLLDSFAYWGARFGVFAGTKWADEQRLSQEAHWINVYAKEAKDALAATPAQSLAAHDAALLRALAEKLDGEGHPANEYYRNWLLAEADRIEKEAQRA